jgi:hypothetical protein
VKIILALIIALAASTARAETPDVILDRLQATNLAQRDELIATRAELAQVKLKAAAAIEANIEQNAAFKGQQAAKDAVIKKQSKTLNSPWVRAILFVRFWLYAILGIGSLAYLLAFVGGICRPGTVLFQLSGKLISFFPGMNIVESAISLFHKTVTVRAAVTPIVEPPVVVTRSSTNSQAADNLAAMAAQGTRPVTAPQAVDFRSNIGWDYATPKAGL